MPIYEILMIFSCIAVLGVMVKGFWSATSVKPIEQPDSWQAPGPTNSTTPSD